MFEVHLTISETEREMLSRMLHDAIKAKRVEVHRTEFSREFRRQLEDEEATMQGLLNKLASADLGSTALG